jgi:nitroreductase
MDIFFAAKRATQTMPWVWRRYQAAKRQVIRTSTSLYYLADMRRVWRSMHWAPEGKAYWALSAELLFQYHKLEKGLVMPGEPRVFGTDPAAASMRLMRRWEAIDLPLNDSIYLGALGALEAFQSHLSRKRLDKQSPIVGKVRTFLAERHQAVGGLGPQYTTPMPLKAPDAPAGSNSWTAFSALANARRSVRDYAPGEVSIRDVEQAVTLAALSPTACNRQPCKVYLVDDAARIASVLALQNGNRGFGHKVPLLGILAVELSGFFDGSERHQPYIDGGLFAMSLMLALRAQGLGSCPLNWCVAPSTDRQLHKLAGIPESQVVTMMLAIGYPVPDCVVPRSARRDLSTILSRI